MSVQKKGWKKYKLVNILSILLILIVFCLLFIFILDFLNFSEFNTEIEKFNIKPISNLENQINLNLTIHNQGSSILNSCSLIEDILFQDYCYNSLAILKENNKICNNIQNISQKNRCIYEINELININTPNYWLLSDNIPFYTNQVFGTGMILKNLEEIAKKDKNQGLTFCKLLDLPYNSYCIIKIAIITQDISICQIIGSETHMNLCYLYFIDKNDNKIKYDVDNELCNMIEDNKKQQQCKESVKIKNG